MKKKILFIVFKGIGDVLLMTPLFKAIKKEYPESKIYILTRKFAANILANNPLIEKVIIREEKPLSRILEIKPDVVIDYMLSSSSGAYTIFSGARERIAFYRPWGRLFYNRLVKCDYDGYTVNERFYLLKPLGINPEKISYIKPEVYFTDENKEKVSVWAKNNEIDFERDKIVTFDITSPKIYRMLPAEKFIYLADKLKKEKKLKPVFHPGPGEEEYVSNSLKKYAKENHILFTGFNLLDLAFLISKSVLHIGTSSAPMHIAVSQNVPTFTIYSHLTNPRGWTPPLDIHLGFQAELEKVSPESIYTQLLSFIEKLKI